MFFRHFKNLWLTSSCWTPRCCWISTVGSSTNPLGWWSLFRWSKTDGSGSIPPRRRCLACWPLWISAVAKWADSTGFWVCHSVRVEAVQCSCCRASERSAIGYDADYRTWTIQKIELSVSLFGFRCFQSKCCCFFFFWSLHQKCTLMSKHWIVLNVIVKFRGTLLV